MRSELANVTKAIADEESQRRIKSGRSKEALANRSEEHTSELQSPVR
jgi:hypothetical protein